MSEKALRLRGLDDLARGMKTKMAPALEEVAKDVGVRTARRVRGHVQAIVPHLTGRLAASVSAEPIKGGGRVGYDGSAVYAGWIDFGGTRGRPYKSGGRYLYPTARAAVRDHVQEMNAAAGREVKVIRWPKPT